MGPLTGLDRPWLTRNQNAHPRNPRNRLRRLQTVRRHPLVVMAGYSPVLGRARHLVRSRHALHHWAGTVVVSVSNNESP
jgi:hypothetical protein